VTDAILVLGVSRVETPSCAAFEFDVVNVDTGVNNVCCNALAGRGVVEVVGKAGVLAALLGDTGNSP
jgi:hypothetical protein